MNRPTPPPPPLASPQPKLDDRDPGEITGRFNIFEAQIAQAVSERTKAVENSATWKMLGTLVGGIVGVAVLYGWVMAQTKDRVDAGIAPVSGQVEVVKQQHAALVEEVRSNQARQDRYNEHTDKQLEVVLDALRVPQWRRPDPVPPKDAGR